jgi:DNA-binding transcriptional ArsR family regulator
MSAAEKLDETLLALADPARRRVIELLRQKPRRAGDLATELRMVAPAMSRHLRVLRTSGLVEEDSLPEDARVRVYRLRAEPFSELRAWLEEVESFWSDQLSAFKAHAEQSRSRASKRAPTASVSRKIPQGKPRKEGGSR